MLPFWPGTKTAKTVTLPRSLCGPVELAYTKEGRDVCLSFSLAMFLLLEASERCVWIVEGHPSVKLGDSAAIRRNGLCTFATSYILINLLQGNTNRMFQF